METINQVRALLTINPDISLEKTINSIQWDYFIREVWAKNMTDYPSSIQGFFRAVEEKLVPHSREITRSYYKVRAEKRMEAERMNILIN